MKLVISIVHNRDKGKITDELVNAGFKFTVIGSSGGFLREGNTTFLLGVEDDQIGQLQSLLADKCSSREQMVNVTPYEAAPAGAFIPGPVKIPVGGAVMFVLNVEQYHRF